MKKLFALIAVFGMLFMGASIFAQDKLLLLKRPHRLLNQLTKEVELQYCTPP